MSTACYNTGCWGVFSCFRKRERKRDVPSAWLHPQRQRSAIASAGPAEATGSQVDQRLLLRGGRNRSSGAPHHYPSPGVRLQEVGRGSGALTNPGCGHLNLWLSHGKQICGPEGMEQSDYSHLPGYGTMLEASRTPTHPVLTCSGGTTPHTGGCRGSGGTTRRVCT